MNPSVTTLVDALILLHFIVTIPNDIAVLCENDVPLAVMIKAGNPVVPDKVKQQ